MAENKAQELANAAGALAATKAKLEESRKELISVTKRIARREAELAAAQTAYNSAFAAATKS